MMQIQTMPPILAAIYTSAANKVAKDIANIAKGNRPSIFNAMDIKIIDSHLYSIYKHLMDEMHIFAKIEIADLISDLNALYTNDGPQKDECDKIISMLYECKTALLIRNFTYAHEIIRDIHYSLLIANDYEYIC